MVDVDHCALDNICDIMCVVSLKCSGAILPVYHSLKIPDFVHLFVRIRPLNVCHKQIINQIFL